MSTRTMDIFNDENAPPAAAQTSKGANAGSRTPRRPLSARSHNIQRDDNGVIVKGRATKPLARVKSAGALPEVDPQAVQKAAEDALRTEAAPKISTVKEILTSTGKLDLSALDDLRSDPEQVRAVLRAQPVGRRCDFRTNEAKSKEYTKKIRETLVHEMRLSKISGETMQSIQESVNSHLQVLADEHAAKVALMQATLEQVSAQAQASQEDSDRRFAEAERQHKESSAAAEQREQQLNDTLEKQAAESRKQAAQLETAQQQIGNLREELARTQAKLEAKTEQAGTLSQEKASLQIAFDSYKEHHGTTSEQQMGAIAELKVMVGDLSKQVDDKKMEVIVHENNVTEGKAQIEALQRQVADEQRRRREMHNAMQEQVGNIRVFCRARPPKDNADVAMHVSETAFTMSVPGSDGGRKEFEFDRVFGFTSTQEDVFEEFSGVVQSALDGYKVCIFAYGQTGSGKTYTMQGANTPTGWGVIPRSLSQILGAVQEQRSQGWRWTLQASFMEVYNESIRDLLDDGSTGNPQRHKIINNKEYGKLVTNMTSVEVDSMEQIRNLMTRASRQRSVGNTDMNAQSSRSHAIFALYLNGANESLNTELTGALHLVDLAGSERLDKSGATGARLKETQNINKSLSSLADVFLAKSENRNHVPVRNSKLTHLMAPCLNGHGKTMMVVNVGPEDVHSHETLCSLRFANQVSQCNTGGKPTRTAKVIGGLDGASASQPSLPQSSGRPAHLTRPPSPKSRPATPPVRANAGGRQTNPFGI
mmetsp:Transcript_130331/g.225287  ORF Transcript_130331/g.225287 Transcript_130331/m.225287 type:complete len:763 (-) Transcript_130331:146-2434(-)